MSLHTLSIIRGNELNQQLSISTSTREKQEKLGFLPPSISLGERAKGWLKHEIDAFIAARALGHSNEELQKLVTQIIQSRKSTLEPFLSQFHREIGED